MKLLERYIAVGINKMEWNDNDPHWHPSGLVRGRWMFAGTFFWFRSYCVFRKNWRDIPIDRYGTEAWLGGLIPKETAVSIYNPWKIKDSRKIDPYNPEIYK